MGAARAFEMEKLVVGALAGGGARLDEAREALEERFGTADAASDTVPFSFTRYYEAEMGPGLLRCWWSFERLVDPAALADIKLATNGIEDGLREEGRRTVNLDPGLLSLSRFVLATTKDSSHRIPLRGGIYAEVTLVYERGAWRPLAWTYPDYRSEPCIAWLRGVRDRYRNQVRGR